MFDRRIRNGAERLIIENLLDHNREALIETVRGLPEAQARIRLVESLTTPISLIKHAAGAERIWFQRFWAGLEGHVPRICPARRSRRHLARADRPAHPRATHAPRLRHQPSHLRQEVIDLES